MFKCFKCLIILKLVNIVLLLFLFLPCASQVIIDHTCTDITKIPKSAIIQAKSQLHIAYGHTSHGSQITDGMTGLIDFANNGGKGLSLPVDIFAWNNGGAEGALDLEEGSEYDSGWLEDDCGYYPQWVNETREYLNDNSHSDVNVIIWSWCGQVSDYSKQDMIDKYLQPMTQLENDYPGVIFVYMSGHADGTGISGNLHKRNQQIREYCIENEKIFYDFYDIECYDPDGNYYGDKNVDDACDYDGGNWAQEWQDSHTQGVDWYDCEAAHTEYLNANQKAYAVWWLWAVLAGWDETTDSHTMESSFLPEEIILHHNFPNPFNSSTIIPYSLPETANINLAIYNINGERICTLRNGYQPKGEYAVTWNGNDDKGQKVSSGIYLYILQKNEIKITNKMILVE